MSKSGEYTADGGISTAVPDVERVLAILDSAFVTDVLPADDIHISTAAPPTLVSADGDTLFEPNSSGPIGNFEWNAEDASGSTHIIERMRQEAEAVALAQALKNVGKEVSEPDSEN